MSRTQIARSQMDKISKNVPPATPSCETETMLQEEEWIKIVDQEDGENFILKFIDDVLETLDDQIFQRYLKRQIIPFTLFRTKQEMMKIVEWQFLSRDEGETSKGWIEDEEAIPTLTDCWAQGSVPRKNVPRPHKTEVKTESRKKKRGFVPRHNITASPKSPEKVRSMAPKKKNMTKPGDHKHRDRNPIKKQTSQPDVNSKETSENEDRSSPDDLRQQLQMPSSCKSLLKFQSGRPPGAKDVVYDEYGNVIAIQKLNPKKFPTHKTRVKYDVIYPEEEAKQAHLEALRTGRYIKGSKRVLHGIRLFSPYEDKEMQCSSKTSTTTCINEHSKGEIFSPCPALFDSMDLSPGVVLREGENVKNGPKLFHRESQMLVKVLKQQLQPITRNTNNSPKLRVSQIALR